MKEIRVGDYFQCISQELELFTSGFYYTVVDVINIEVVKVTGIFGDEHITTSEVLLDPKYFDKVVE